MAQSSQRGRAYPPDRVPGTGYRNRHRRDRDHSPSIEDPRIVWASYSRNAYAVAEAVSARLASPPDVEDRERHTGYCSGLRERAYDGSGANETTLAGSEPEGTTRIWASTHRPRYA